MQQDIDLLVQVVMKCLADTIIPALEDRDRVSCEQARLCLKALSGIKELIPVRHDFARACLKSTIDVATEMAALMDPLDEFYSVLTEEIAKCQKLHDQSAITVSEIGAADQSLNELTCNYTEKLTLQNDMSKVLLRASKQKLAIQRAWCFDSGIEPEDILGKFIRQILREQAHEQHQ